MAQPLKLFWVGILLLASLTASAQNDNPRTCGGTQSVYFLNGVGVVSRDDAVESFRDIVPALKANLPSRQTRYSIAYNRSLSGLRGDILESVRQILGNEYPSLLIGYLLRLGDIPSFLIPDSLRTKLNDALRSDWARKMIQGPSSEADVLSHVSMYSADIARGRKVAVISHSQGNIFANMAYLKLTSDQRNYFSMIPVAVPDSIIRKSFVGHVTFFNDLVIDAVQLVRVASGLPLAPLPNDLAQSPGTVWAHYFSEDYLDDSSAKSFIINGVKATLNTLPQPSSTLCEPLVDAVKGHMGPNCLSRLLATKSQWEMQFPGLPIVMLSVTSASTCKSSSCVQSVMNALNAIGVTTSINPFSFEHPDQWPNPRACINFRTDIFTQIGLPARGRFEANCVAAFLGSPPYGAYDLSERSCSGDGFPIPGNFE